MKTFIWTIYSFLSKNKDFTFEQQKEMIDSYKEPNNDFERTYFNYNASIQGCSKFSLLIMDFLGIVVIPIFLMLYCINRLRKSISYNCFHHDAILINNNNRIGVKYDYEGRVPEELINQYSDFVVLKFDVFPRFTEGVISFPAFKIWFSFFFRHPFNGYINFRSLINIMAFNRLILEYSPKIIVNARAELNNISSLITLLCEKNDIEYINFMHGEVLTSINTAFVRFSKFYIWDEHYKEIFKWSRCPLNQFVVYKPAIYKQDIINSEKKPGYYITYYFSGDEKKRIDKNAENVLYLLNLFERKGYHCKVRPHPRWSNIEHLKHIFRNSYVEIEDPQKISVMDSITSSVYIIGTFSTVLSEAYYMNSTIVIDDITDKELYINLKKMKYILLSKPHMLFSELLQKNNIEIKYHTK